MFQRCNKCLTPNTRPRIKFNQDSICSACQFHEKKKMVDWDLRYKELQDLCDKHRRDGNSFDVIVPAGGGKDSSYVAWNLKHEFNMNPLCICAVPPLATDLGAKNIQNFADAGFSLIQVTTNPILTKKISKNSFIKYGRPQFDWLHSIMSIPLRFAIDLKIPLIFYGEEAESEYGGSQNLENKAKFNIDHIREFYNSGVDFKELIEDNSQIGDYYYLNLPTENEIIDLNIEPVHWSYYQQWDEHKHLELAINKCGLLKSEKNTSGAFNNFSHLDQRMYLLHMYLAYLKFGFGRATTDAAIEIRHGNISFETGLNYIKKYDHIFPTEFLSDYLDYFDMKEEEFFEICETHRNKEIFYKKNGNFYLEDSH